VPAIEGIRVDSGIGEGSVVGASYDSMLAKVIAHGRDREEARRRLVSALQGTVLDGVESNLDYLRDVLECPSFRAATISTRFLEGDFAAERATHPESDGAIDLLAAAAARVLEIERERLGRRPVPWDRLGSWRVTRGTGQLGRTVTAFRLEENARVDIGLAGNEGRYRAHVEGVDHEIEAWWSRDGDLRLTVDGTTHRRSVTLANAEAWVSGGLRHRHLALLSRDQQVAEREAAAGDVRDLVAPFPGLVTSVEVAAGDTVEAGFVLVVMEAMKMVHTLRAAGAGVVRSVNARPGITVPAGHLLVEFGESAT
jgi:acetyl/propionyl-CoA carboxylase alpha subunit